MTVHTNLRDVSQQFESDLLKISAELFSVKRRESFEERVHRRLRDLKLFMSKLWTLEAKPISSNHQDAAIRKNEASVKKKYGDKVTNKVIEQMFLKSVKVTHSVKKLLSTPDVELNKELLYRKQKILTQLQEYFFEERELIRVMSSLQEKEQEHCRKRVEWDMEMYELRSMRSTIVDNVDSSEPLYQRLQTLVNKMELMRWLISRLVLARSSHYDWLSDTKHKLQALKVAREANTVENFIQQH